MGLVHTVCVSVCQCVCVLSVCLQCVCLSVVSVSLVSVYQCVCVYLEFHLRGLSFTSLPEHFILTACRLE